MEEKPALIMHGTASLIWLSVCKVQRLWRAEMLRCCRAKIKKKDLIFTRIDLKSKLIIYSTQSPLKCTESFLLSPQRINELEALLHITLYCMITWSESSRAIPLKMHGTKPHSLDHINAPILLHTLLHLQFIFSLISWKNKQSTISKDNMTKCPQIKSGMKDFCPC